MAKLNPEVEEHFRLLIRAEFWVHESKNSLPKIREFTKGRRQGFEELLHILGLAPEADNIYRDETMKLRQGHYSPPGKKDYRKMRRIERSKRRIVLPGSRLDGPG